MKVLLLHVFPLLCTASIHYPSHTFPLEVAKQQNHKQDRLETEVQLADQAAEGSTDVATTIIIPAKRPIRRNRVRTIKSLLNSFPFRQQVRHHPAAALTRQQDSALTRQQDSVLTRQQDSVLTQLAAAETDPETGRRCVDKVMLREETEYDEILTCDHSYDNRCHTSYVTRYEPVQEQHCDEKFRKVCTIDYEQKALQELVEVCTTPFVPDCEEEGEEECRTVYESECITQQVVHQVEDDVANCQTEQEEKCMEVTEGFTTRQQCDTWPVERCKLEKKLVQKYTPKTACQKVPKEMCAPAGCGIKEGPVQCQDRVKTVIVDNPVEECDMEPLRTCKHITKLVPKLEPTQECVDVPKEICARSKVNPRKVKKPSIQKWCFVPGQNSSLECGQDQDCGPGTICTQGTCLEGCREDSDCGPGFTCSQSHCLAVAGKVLLASLTVETAECRNCSVAREGVVVSLAGERTAEYTAGYPCTTAPDSPLDHQDRTDFSQAGAVARFAGEDARERASLGSCYRAPLNALLRGGLVRWVGQGEWTPASVCVDWLSSNYAYECGLVEAGLDQTWELSDCRESETAQRCAARQTVRSTFRF